MFDAETRGHVYQSKDKRYEILESEQYVVYVYHIMGRDRFGPIIVEGWTLTHRGRIAYCEWAKEQPVLPD